MSSDGSSPLEDLVAEFLDQRENDPGLAVEAFAEAHPHLQAELEAAIRCALGVQDRLRLAGLPIPERIGPYRIGRLLGRGGMGLVFEAECEGRSYALKLLALGAGASALAQDRFHREARSLARLSHPGIVRVHDSGVFQGAPYLVMERVDGPTLDQVGVPMAAEKAVRIVRDLALAVAAAHEAGLLHRDLKPSNVILQAGGRPVLLDFGLAQAEDESSLTASGAVLGTPRYMAPEQAEGAAADERTDVHALGLILFELLHGTPARPAGSRATVLREVRQGRPGTPRSPAVPRSLEGLLGSVLAREPRRRPPSARALAEDLAHFLAGEPLRQRAPRMDQHVFDAARRHPLRALLALASIVAMVFLFARSRGASVALRAARVRVEAHIDAALCGWMQGSLPTARYELDQARALNPSAVDVAAIQAALDGHSLPRGASVWIERGLVPLMAGDSRSAREGLAPLVERSAPAAALEARARALLGDGDGALEAAWKGVRSFHESAALWAEAVRLLEESGQPGEALARLASAPAPVTAEAPLLAARVRLALATGAWDEALQSALLTVERLHKAGADPALELPRLLVLSEQNEATRAALGRRIAAGDRNPLLQFALAYSLDSDHRLQEAEAAYEKVLELDGRFLRARLNLAHLHAGAQRTACQACDRAYAENPAVLSPAQALEDLRLALSQDRGEGELCVTRAVQTALSLEAREPEAHAVRFVGARLGELLERSDLTPAARLRVTEGLSRLSTAGSR